MKNIVLGALLVGSLASQSAFAEIRTFDFSASVSSLLTIHGFKSTVSGIHAGTTVSKGDLIEGRLSFDDLGRDWDNAVGSVSAKPALQFEYTFVADGTTVSFDAPTWSHNPKFLWLADLFTARGVSGELNANSMLTLLSPVGGHSWELGNGTSGTLSLNWSGVTGLAKLTSFTEVSPVPEPSTYGMMLIGAAVVAGAAKRRARRAA